MSSRLNRSSIGSSKQNNSNKSTPASVNRKKELKLTKNERLDAAIVLLERGTAMLKELVTTDDNDERESGDDSSVSVAAVKVTQDLSVLDDDEDENVDGDGQHEPIVDLEARFRKGPSGLADFQKKDAAKFISLGIAKSVVATSFYKLISAQAFNNLKACPSSEMPAFISELRADFEAGLLPQRVMDTVQPLLFPETAAAAAAAASKPKTDQYATGMPASGLDVSTAPVASSSSSSKKIATFTKASGSVPTGSVAAENSPAKRKHSDASTEGETPLRPFEFEKMGVPDDVFKVTVSKSARLYYEKPEKNWVASFDGSFFWKFNDKFVVEFDE